MRGEDFDSLVATGLLSAVERIVVDAYLAGHPGASRPDAYRWLHFEDPDPVARLDDAVRRLARAGAQFDAAAVDKACLEASKLGYSNS